MKIGLSISSLTTLRMTSIRLEPVVGAHSSGVGYHDFITGSHITLRRAIISVQSDLHLAWKMVLLLTKILNAGQSNCLTASAERQLSNTISMKEAEIWQVKIGVKYSECFQVSDQFLVP